MSSTRSDNVAQVILRSESEQDYLTYLEDLLKAKGDEATVQDLRKLGYFLVKNNKQEELKRYLKFLARTSTQSDHKDKAAIIHQLLTNLPKDQTHTLLALLLKNDENMFTLAQIFSDVAFGGYSNYVKQVLNSTLPDNQKGWFVSGTNPPIFDFIAYIKKQALKGDARVLFYLLEAGLIPEEKYNDILIAKDALFQLIEHLDNYPAAKSLSPDDKRKRKAKAVLHACNPTHPFYKFFAKSRDLLPTRANAGTRKKVYNEIYALMQNADYHPVLRELFNNNKSNYEELLKPVFKMHPDAEIKFVAIKLNISEKEAQDKINARNAKQRQTAATSSTTTAFPLYMASSGPAAMGMAHAMRQQQAPTRPPAVAVHPPQAQFDDGPPAYAEAIAITPGEPVLASPANPQQTGELVEALRSMSRSFLTRTVFTPHTFLIAVHAEAIPQSLAFGLLENKRFRNELKQYLEEIENHQRFEHATIRLARSFPLRTVKNPLFKAVQQKIQELDKKEAAKTAPYQPSNSILARADQIANKLGKATKEAKRLTSKAITASMPASYLFDLLIREQIAASTINFRFRNDDAFAEMFTQHLMAHYRDRDVQAVLKDPSSALKSVIRNNEPLRTALQEAEDAQKQQAAALEQAAAVTPGAAAQVSVPAPAPEYVQIGDTALNVTRLREQAKTQPHLYVLGIALGVLKREDITGYDLIRLKSVIDTNSLARQRLIHELSTLNSTAAQRVVENVEPKAGSADERSRLHHLLFANNDVRAAYQALAQRVAQAKQQAVAVKTPAHAERSTPDQMYPSACFVADKPAVPAPVPSAPPVDAAPPEYNSKQMHADADRAKKYAAQAANGAEVAPSVSVAQPAKPSDIAEYIRRAEQAADLAKRYTEKGNAEKAADAAKVAAEATGRVLSAREHTDTDLNRVQRANFEAHRAVATAKANAAEATKHREEQQRAQQAEAARAAKRREEQQRARQAAIAADAERLNIKEDHLRLMSVERELLQPVASSAPNANSGMFAQSATPQQAKQQQNHDGEQPMLAQ